MVRKAGNSNAAGEYPPAFTEIGLFGRIGTLGPKSTFPGVQKLNVLNDGWESALPASVRSALAGLSEQGELTSATGELTLNTKKKSFKVIAPKGEVMTFLGDESGDVMRLTNGNRYQTVALLSLDGKALKESEKILLFQLSNLAGTKQKFANDRRNLLESWGDLPILQEKSRVEVELALPVMKVEALKLDGTPNGTIPSQYENGKLRFVADTASRPGSVMVYLLTR